MMHILEPGLCMGPGFLMRGCVGRSRLQSERTVVGRPLNGRMTDLTGVPLTLSTPCTHTGRTPPGRSLRVLMVLPALTEAKSPFWRPIKYSLFPPLGLAQLAACLDPDRDAVRLVDEHVGPELPLETEDSEDPPDLVVVQVYITNADRAYRIADHYRARGSHVALGGLHVTSLPEEAAAHADTIALGPGDATFPAFIQDLRAGRPKARYDSRDLPRTLVGVPPPRRDLIDRARYLVPNSIVVTRSCPFRCDFCYKQAFFAGGKIFYTQLVDDALAEIDRLPGRHLYFLDDHLLGDPRFAAALFEGMRGMGRVFQGAATIDSILRGDTIQRAAEAGLRSLFVGFETLDAANLKACDKRQNLGRSYDVAIRRLDDLGIMINGSFVFGLDGDRPDVFKRTFDWAVSRGITTSTFHVATPYPGTAYFQRIEREGRLLHRDWSRYDTRHAVFQPRGMSVSELDAGYRWAYDAFYRRGAILRGARRHGSLRHRVKHAAYAAGWKKCEPVWNLAIKSRRLALTRPGLEAVLSRAPRARGPHIWRPASTT